MDDIEFQSTLRNMENLLSGSNFVIIYAKYNPESFGNYYIDISNKKFSYRLIKDRSQYFLEGKSVDSDNWMDISKFVETNFKGSSLAFDMKLHRIGIDDFTLPTVLKLLPKLVIISEKR